MSGLRLQKDVSLRPFNFLRLEAQAETFAFLDDRSGIADLCHLVKKSGDYRILGEGSNVVLKGPRFPLVVQVALKGIEFISEGDEVIVKASGGESWAGLVDATVKRDLYGIESLALIPGSVGAAPVQNIGAYGQEVGNVISQVEVLNLRTGKISWYQAVECEFVYRSSRFKRSEHRDDLILSVHLRLSSQPRATEAESPGTPFQIAEQTKQIRRSKLPDPVTEPNVGSFFLNPILNEGAKIRLQEIDAGAPIYVHGENFKTSAAWLIEKSGWKGQRRPDGVGVSEKHALVLVNYSSRDAEPLLQLAQDIVTSVHEKFGIKLEMEPRIFEA